MKTELALDETFHREGQQGPRHKKRSRSLMND
jgi:hypothetical protein